METSSEPVALRVGASAGGDNDGRSKDSGGKNAEGTERRNSSQSDGRGGASADGTSTSKPKANKTSTKNVSTNALTKQIVARPKAEISLRTLLEAGVHFGHQTSRWDPSMSQYIYTVRNGIHIIHLPKTMQSWSRAAKSILDIISDGGQILFVGTKKQAQEALVEEARRCGAFFVSQRWLGGMLTNFQTIRKSIERMRKVESILAEEEQLAQTGQPQKFTKKERLMMSRELQKLDFSLGGIKDMHGLPQVLFVVDIKREEIAIKEAKRMDIPVVALVDTNCNPGQVVYPIPSNDDGTRAIRLFAQAVADVVAEGRKNYADRQKEQKEKRDKERAAQSKAQAAERAAKAAEAEAREAAAKAAGAAEAEPTVAADSATSE